MIKPEHLLTPVQAATRLCVKANTLCAWRIKGVGPAYYHIEGRVYYTQHDLDAYLSSVRHHGKTNDGR